MTDRSLLMVRSDGRTSIVISSDYRNNRFGRFTETR
jgi:hypothetical protein